ncbi:hypothetical protein [Hespellia stercorisuis]|uniref:Uncharacterized protein n=1 Tax=Hespellia stercorisuis DSM 15480 TaxID=1121950 RepID=A0A1M6RPJ6_9FIRM|nr:hypothetical protein [Hespellia stercorisuis]SHK34354.1 hypothetical protein SAMN02745243_02752 [Hespellia stercorisuis DSM 15480]
MEKEFSEGFMHNIADLLDICAKNNTDNVDLEIDVNGRTLKVNITFQLN